MKQFAGGDEEDLSQDLGQQTARGADAEQALHARHGHPPRKAPQQQSPNQAQYHCTQAAKQPKARQRAIKRSWQEARAQDNSDSEPDSNVDSIHTAHFSDEGELSESDTGATAEQPQERRQTKQGPVVLYHGPNSKQLAAARASAKPPPGPRPHLGDVLLEAIHSDDVKKSGRATGALEEALPQDKWQCIMRRRQADGCCSPHVIKLFDPWVELGEPTPMLTSTLCSTEGIAS